MQLSDAQREMLCEMTNSAYVEIRQLAQAGRLEQGFDLAAVFHSLLNNIWSEDFDLMAFRAEILTAYQLKYPEATSANYVARVDQIIAQGREGSPELKPEVETIVPQLPLKDAKLPSGVKPD